jgi:hypothetical protein
VKALGVAAAAFAVICMISIGLSIGHFRDALIADAAEPARAASLAFKSAPFALRDLMSWLLFAVSVLFAVFALFDGLSSDDRYPGYGPVARRARQSRDDYLGELQGIRKALEELKNEELELLERNMQKARTYVAESVALLRDKNWLRTRLDTALLDAENCLDALLKIVRDTNRMHRGGVPTPGYFDSRPTLQSLGIPDFGTTDDRARLAEHERLVERLLAEADGIRTVIEETFNTYAARLKPGYRSRHRTSGAHAQK